MLDSAEAPYISEIPNPELDKRIVVVETLLKTLSEEQTDRLLKTYDGQAILSVLLGLKPALLLEVGLTKLYLNPSQLINTIRQQSPTQFQLSHRFFYDPEQVISVINNNRGLFPGFDQNQQDNPSYLNRYLEDITYDPAFGNFLPLLEILGLRQIKPEVHSRLGLICGYPNEAIADFSQSSSTLVYSDFGYTFGYSSRSQSAIDIFDSKLHSAYSYVEKRIPQIAERSKQPVLYMYK